MIAPEHPKDRLGGLSVEALDGAAALDLPARLLSVSPLRLELQP